MGGLDPARRRPRHRSVRAMGMAQRAVRDASHRLEGAGLPVTKALLVGAVSRKSGQTPESQLRALRDIAARKGWETEELSFTQSRWDDESAAEVRKAVTEKLTAGGFNVLAVWAFDRISRAGPEEALRFIRVLEDHYAVRFFSLQEPFLCTEADQGQRTLMLSILAWIANQESGRKSERVRARVRQKRDAAAKLGQAPKWGRGKLPTDAQLARVGELRALGLSVRAIAKETGMSKSAVARVPVPVGTNQ